MTEQAAVTFPAPTAKWGEVVAVIVPVSYPRNTAEQIRKCRYHRRYLRQFMRLRRMDPGCIGCHATHTIMRRIR